MKRFLPLILFLVGVIVLIGVFVVLKRGSNKQETSEDEGSLIEVSLSDRPLTSLTPSSDGHWLKLKIEKIKISASSLDYELLYSLPDGRTQGVPGTINLKGETSIERDLLLGSESSGKFRYDEGVEEGTLTLRFRNDKGKLITKFSTKFHLESGVKSLSSIDGKFSFELAKTASKVFFVTMETFGIPEEAPVSVKTGPLGVFASGKGPYAGKVSLKGGKIFVYQAGTWEEVTGGESSDIGIFIAGE